MMEKINNKIVLIEDMRNVRKKVVDFWFRNKALVLICSLLVFILTIMSFILGRPVINKKNKNILNKDFIKEKIDENWEKLTVNGGYKANFSLSPKNESNFGINPKETFVLKTTNKEEESFVINSLVASKPVAVSKVDDYTYDVKLTSALGMGEVVSFNLKSDSDYSWAFQTAKEFKITESLPRNEAKDVPTNAGIELTFNNDDFRFNKENIIISPKIDFRIEKNKQIVTIIPTKILNPKTVYTVTVKKGLSLTDSNNSIKDDYSFSFQTAEIPGETGRIALANNFQEVFPDETLMAKVYSNNYWENQENKVEVEVYKFSSVDDFVLSRKEIDQTPPWMTYYGENDPVETKNMTLVLKNKINVLNQNNIKYLQLPKPLDEGFYLVQFWIDDHKKVEQLWVQSSPIVGYTSVGKVHSMVWINSPFNEDLGEATIELLGTGFKYSTNIDGWTTFPTPDSLSNKKNKQYFLVKLKNNKQLLLPYEVNPKTTTSNDYWSYLYHEKYLYRMGDTVNFWGVAKNRDTGLAPDKIDLYFDNKLVKSVVPNQDGSFMDKIKLEGVDYGYTSFEARVEGVSLVTSYFDVTEYTKPEIKIEVEADKKVIFAGERVNYKAKVSFFDGTPVPNMKLTLSPQRGIVENKLLVTDKQGMVKFNFQAANPIDYEGYAPVTISTTASGESSIDDFANVYVYKSKLKINPKANQEKNKAYLEATVNSLDLDLINKKGFSNPISGVVKNKKVNLVIVKSWWEEKEVGNYYDYVEKITRPKYESIKHSETMVQTELNTNNEGKINYEFEMEIRKTYEATLGVIDDEGRRFDTKNYFYYSDYQKNQEQPKAYLDMDRMNNLFSVGEPIDIKIKKEGNDFAKKGKEKFLFVLANRGKQDVFITEQPELKIDYKKEYIPDIYIGSIIFNGRFYEEVENSCKSGWSCNYADYWYYGNGIYFSPIQLSYKEEDSNLNLTITSDKTSYAPGDKAVLIVQVLNKEIPVEGATVQLTMVDEALAAINGVKEPSVLTSLYKTVSSMIYYNYYSHKPLFPDKPVSEKGGGGGERDLFKDTAFFDSGKTNSEGKVSFSVDLPDNITNWLIYAQSLTNNLEAGQTKYSVIVSKDFFLTSHFPKSMVKSDVPYLGVNTFGNSLSDKNSIPIEVEFLKGNEKIGENKITNTAFMENYVEFPKLEPGDYKVSTRGSFNNQEDKITLPLTVLDSRFLVNLAKNKVINEGEKFKSFEDVEIDFQNPAKLIITDEGKGKYFYSLYNYCFQNSNRLEKRIASIKADKIISQKFSGVKCNKYNDSLSGYQRNDGGLSQVEWGGSNLETTLWATYVDPTVLDKEELIKYFKLKINEDYGLSTEEKILANWGLTLLGENKLNELVDLSSKANTYREKVFSGLALLSAGNKEKAKQIYFEILETYAYTNKPYLKIEANGEDSADTSYALLLGLLTVRDYNDGFNLYLRDYVVEWEEKVALDLAKISYINSVLSELSNQDTKVSYRNGTSTETKNVTKDGPLVVSLDKNKINNFELSVLSGRAEANLNYFVNNTGLAKTETDDRIELTRKVKKVGGSEGEEIRIGDILEISLYYDFDNKAPQGGYLITDILPSGLSFIERPSIFGFNDRLPRLYESNNQIIKGTISNSDWWRYDHSVYYARVTAAGKFIHEPAIIQSLVDINIFQKTPENYLTIEK